MAAACYNTCLDIAEENRVLAMRMKMCAPGRRVDGGYFPDTASLVGFLSGVARASDSDLLHQHTLSTLHSCKMLAGYLYETEPVWMKFEGEPMPLRSARR